MCSNNVCCSRTWANYCGGNFVPVENAVHEKYFDRSKSAAMSNFCVYTMNFAKCPKKRTSIYTHIELMNTSKCINISWATHRIERKQCYNSFDVMRSELRWLKLIEVRCIWFVYFSKTFYVVVVVVFRHFCGFFHSNQNEFIDESPVQCFMDCCFSIVRCIVRVHCSTHKSARWLARPAYALLGTTTLTEQYNCGDNQYVQ